MSHEERKLDTRRKIAMGGLVIKAGLDREEPAVLLGMLMSAARVLSSPNADEHRRRWRERGDTVFKGSLSHATPDADGSSAGFSVGHPVREESS